MSGALSYVKSAKAFLKTVEQFGEFSGFEIK
jgi:hypothetical protein